MNKISNIGFAVLITILMGLSNHLSAQINQQKLPEKTRILFLLDASGSMLGQWENTNRITAAKKLLGDLVDSLKVNPDLEIALRVYGHQFDKRFQNCTDTKLEVGFKVNNHDLIKNKLSAIIPKGTTPLAFSLEQAANDFPNANDVRNIIIIITDGLESCEGDPCAISLALQRKRIFLKPFVIGLGMNKSFNEEFACLGQFFDADNIRKFRQVLNTAIKQTMDKTSVSVELLDEHGNRNVTNINVTFVNNMTQEPAYNFVHYRDANGRPDSVEIDGVLSYDMVVNTIPPIYKKNVNVVPGRHNVFEIKAPQGSLYVRQPGHTEYKDGVKILVRKIGQSGIIHVQGIDKKDKYLVGNYDLEILTLPKIYINDVKISPRQLNEINIPNPGVLNLYSNVAGNGSLYTLEKDGKQRFVMDLEEGQTRYSMAIQPGKYRLVYRAKNSFGSKYTTINDFEITSGLTKNIKLIGG